MYKQFLDSALETLFKPIKENGFWDEEKGRIAERLYFDEEWNWSFVPSDKMRYMVFCLSNLLLAKEHYNLNTNKVDDKIISSLKYLNKNKEHLTISDLTYGALLSVFLQKKFYNVEDINLGEWILVFEKALDASLIRKDNHDALVLIAGKYFLEEHPGHPLQQKLKMLADNYLEAQNATGYFETGDLRANYHQRNMYVLWGLLAATSFYPEKKDEIGACVHKTLSWVWKNRRDSKDNAFYWHPPFYWIKNKLGIITPILNSGHSKFLFECHQTFFVNAVNFYQEVYGSNEFSDEKVKAMEWIFGKNRIKKDLVAVTGIHLPVRIMHINGGLYIKNQNFKGTYEIGSYILALTSFQNK